MPRKPLTLLPLNDVAAVCGVTPQQIRQWLSDGAIGRPALPGRRGRGGQHFFSLAQAYALAAAVGLYGFGSPSCSFQLLQQTYVGLSELTEAAVRKRLEKPTPEGRLKERMDRLRAAVKTYQLTSIV